MNFVNLCPVNNYPNLQVLVDQLPESNLFSLSKGSYFNNEEERKKLDKSKSREIKQKTSKHTQIMTTDSQAVGERNFTLAHCEDTAGHFSKVILDGCQVNLVLMPFNKMSCDLCAFSWECWQGDRLKNAS